ncbi:PPM-type phosphatase domain-containing protein [Entamoeba marina]
MKTVYAIPHHKRIKKHFSSSISALPKIHFKQVRPLPLISHKDVISNDCYNIAFQGELFSANCFSTYPIKNNKKVGEPIADRYAIQMYDNCTVSCIADGCGWGEKSRAASTTAINSFFKVFDSTKLGSTVRDIGNILVEWLISIHEDVCNEGAGTTTILMVVIVEIENGKYYGISLSVGDCSLFVRTKGMWSRISGNVRKEMKGMSAMEGRIGQHKNSFGSSIDIPELKISELKGFECNADDIVLVMSDGLADNLDPMLTGINPKQLELSGWSSSNAMIKRENYVLTTLNTFYNISSSLNDFIESLTQECVKRTRPIRKYVSTHKGRIPLDPMVVPGKVDHVSLLTYRVCEICSSDVTPIKFCESESCHELLDATSTKPIVTTANLTKSSQDIQARFVTQSLSPSGLARFQQRRFSIQTENMNLHTSPKSTSPLLHGAHSPNISLSPRLSLSPRRSPSGNGSPLLAHNREQESCRSTITPVINTTEPHVVGLNDGHSFVRYFLPFTTSHGNPQD